MMLKLIAFVALLAGATNGQGLSSCDGRCFDSADHSYNCQCNTLCEQYLDCCDDYNSLCKASDTCAGRCDANLDNSKTCQCNSHCVTYGDCCPDYDTLCNSPGGGGSSCSAISVTDNEILEISLALWTSDVNRASSNEVIVDEQVQTDENSQVDAANKPFFTYVDPAVLERPTFKSLIALLDNYDKFQGYNEVITQEELDEQSNFLDEVLATSVGQQLYNFLASKNMAGCEDIDTFKSYLQKMWFEMYSRRNGAMDTSGFEHVFVGEIKVDYVSGFHNWVQFYFQELYGILNYYGYVTQSQPMLYGNHFTWDDFMKELGGTAVGASPEVEMALFTLCHMTRPGRLCTVQLLDDQNNQVTRQIQTYTWSNSNPGSGLQYVASAYFRV